MTDTSTELPEALDGQRIDRVVAMVCDLPRAIAADLVAGGNVRLDGTAVRRRSSRVRAGQHLAVVDIPAPEAATVVGPEAGVDFEVVHEDDHIIVVDKPAGLVVHPGAGNLTGTLAHGLLQRYPELAGVGERDRPGIVHRLDRDTSGLLVVARTEAAHHVLSAALRRHDVERRYHTLVWGHVAEPRGLIDAPIARSPREPTKMAVVVGGRPARTSYEVLRTFDDPVAVSEVICQLETGRTHQIRVHLQGLGHPVLGDPRYGGERQSFPLGRQFLHATHLAFSHPVSGALVACDSPLPADLQHALDALG